MRERLLIRCFMTMSTFFVAYDPEKMSCGSRHPTPDGLGGICNPYHKYTCCSPQGWCGGRGGHCACRGCIDYTSETIVPTAKP